MMEEEEEPDFYFFDGIMKISFFYILVLFMFSHETDEDVFNLSNNYIFKKVRCSRNVVFLMLENSFSHKNLVSPRAFF